MNKLAIEAIADLQDFSGKEFPKLYGERAIKPVTGGFFGPIRRRNRRSGPENARRASPSVGGQRVLILQTRRFSRVGCRRPAARTAKEVR